MLSSRTHIPDLHPVLSELAGNEISWKDTNKHAHGTSFDDSITESESTVEISEEDEESIYTPTPSHVLTSTCISPTPSAVLPMGPPPPRLLMKKKRGPYKTKPKPLCSADGCERLSTSARSTLCLRHKQRRRIIKDQCVGSVVCVFPIPGSRCKNTPFRNELCRKHYDRRRAWRMG